MTTVEQAVEKIHGGAEPSVIAAVFDDVIDQPAAIETLSTAALAAAQWLSGESATAGAMTHAWLFTGPAGSGRSVAARAFAAALQCAELGCGHCAACRTALAGTHADVRVVVPQGLTIGVAEMRSLVLRAATAPSGGRWQIVLIEDADRLTEAAANAILKAIEEPPARTVFMLCAPSADPADLPVTIRSRCRLVALRTPALSAVARILARNKGVDSATAEWAAAAAQGHVGRARRLANDVQARERRGAVLQIPRSLSNIGACFSAAERLLAAAEAEAAADTQELDVAETQELARALGDGGTGKGAAAAKRGISAATKELAKRQKSRLTRAQRDALDRALVDLAAFYRDALMLRLGAPVAATHLDVLDTSRAAARAWTPQVITARIDAVLECQQAIAENVKPRIALEALMLRLR